MIRLDQLNKLKQEDFIHALGGIYELSPWVADAAWSRKPFADRESLITSMRAVVDEADANQKLKLLKSHPDLAGKLAVEDRLTEASKCEQASLGLDRLSPKAFDELSELNQRYHKRFDFPFIICVRLVKDIPELLDCFRERIGHEAGTERETAIGQVHSIARLRLEDLVH